MMTYTPVNRPYDTPVSRSDLMLYRLGSNDDGVQCNRCPYITNTCARRGAWRGARDERALVITFGVSVIVGSA